MSALLSSPSLSFSLSLSRLLLLLIFLSFFLYIFLFVIPSIARSIYVPFADRCTVFICHAYASCVRLWTSCVYVLGAHLTAPWADESRFMFLFVFFFSLFILSRFLLFILPPSSHVSVYMRIYIGRFFDCCCARARASRNKSPFAPPFAMPCEALLIWTNINR